MKTVFIWNETIFLESAKNDPTYMKLKVHMTWELIKAEKRHKPTAQQKRVNKKKTTKHEFHAF